MEPSQQTVQPSSPTIKTEPPVKKHNLILFGIIAFVLIGIFFFIKTQNSNQTPTQPTNTPKKSSQAELSNPTSNWKEYKNSELGFSFSYPKELTVNDQLSSIKQTGTGILLLQNEATPGSSSNFQLQIKVYKNPTLSLDKYVNNSQAEIKQNLKNQELRPPQAISINNLKAMAGEDMVNSQLIPAIWLKSKDLFFTIEVTTPKSTNMKWFDYILSTLKFNE